MSIETAEAKRCTNCGTDVTHGKRMKGSNGQYWCIACGSADQIKKHGTTSQSQCPMCNNMYPPADAHRIGEHYVCSKCAGEARTTGKVVAPSAMKSARTKKLILGSALLILGFGLIFAHFSGLMDELLY